MKKNLIILVALLTMFAFAGGVMAQGQTKPTAPAATEKPATSAAEKPTSREERDHQGDESNRNRGSL